MTPADAQPTHGALVEVHTTYPTRKEADAAAARLVHGRLAACAQVDGPVRSVYAWQGAVETADEWRCICKTTAARAPACIEAIVAAHPYETPQIIEIPCSASVAYAAWVRASVGESSASEA